MTGRLGWILALGAVAFGTVIIACHIESGGNRWQAAAWRYAILVPGSPATWGVVIFAAGLLASYGLARRSRRALLTGYTLAFLWFCTLTTTALLAVGDDLIEGTRAANPLAAAAWFGFAMIYADSADRARKARP